MPNSHSINRIGPRKRQNKRRWGLTNQKKRRVKPRYHSIFMTSASGTTISGPLGWRANRLTEDFDTLNKNPDEEESSEGLNITPELAEDIQKLRSKRKRKIRKYWALVLEAVNEVERDRRAQKAQLMHEEVFAQQQHDEATNYVDDDENGDDNPWDEKNINKASSFNEWLIKARSTLPSVKGIHPTHCTVDCQLLKTQPRKREIQHHDPFEGTRILEGKYYRQFKAAGNHVYAKCALTDDPDDPSRDFDDHLYELQHADSNPEYRKKFDYFQELERIKSFPCTLKQKKAMFRYMKNEAKYFQSTGCQCKLRCYPCLHRLALTIRGVLAAIVPIFLLWKIPIHQMYAFFGVEALYYFIWLRQIFITQLFYLSLALIVMVIPEYYEEPVGFGGKGNVGLEFHLSDLLNGGGYFETSISSYGGYSQSKPINANEPLTNILESTEYRFIVLWGLVNFGNTVNIIIRMFYYKQYSKQSLHDESSSGGSTLSYFNTVFCSWEFSVNSVQLSASVRESIAKKFSQLHSRVTSDAIKAYNYTDPKGKTFRKLLTKLPGGKGLRIYHFVVNLTTIGVAVISSISLHFIMAHKGHVIQQQQAGIYSNLKGRNIFWFYVPGLYMSVLINIISPFIVYLSDVELWYRRQRRNFFVVGRLSLIYLAHYITLYSYWTQRAQDFRGRNDRCYENNMSRSFYKILLWEFAFTLSYWIFKEVIVNFILWRCKKNYTAPEVSMDIMLVSLIFRHALLHMVIQFAPLLPVITLSTLFITFYVKKTILSWIFSHPKYFAHPSDYDLPYFLCFYLFFLVQTFCSFHFMLRSPASSSCGLLRLNNVHNISHYRHDTALSYTIIFDNLRTHYPFRHAVYQLLQLPALGYGLLACICGLIYIVKKWGEAVKRTVEFKQKQLEHARKDRAFLLRAIFEAAKEGKAKQEESLNTETSSETTQQSSSNNPDEESANDDIESYDDHLVLDKRNIFKAKVKTIGALVAGGKRRFLSRKYKSIQKKRQAIMHDFEKKSAGPETEKSKMERLTALKAALAAEILQPTKEEIEARRASMAARMLMNYESIKFVHQQQRQQRHLQWDLQNTGTLKNKREKEKQAKQ